MNASEFRDDQRLSKEAFAYLRAEREIRWLARVFVSPSDFVAMSDSRSCVIFGESGAGKSALRLELARQSTMSAERPLVALWQPYLPAPERPSIQTLSIFSQQIFEASALALLEHIGHHPQDLAVAPQWVQAMATWFLQRYLQAEWNIRLERMTESYPREGVNLLRNLFDEPAEPYLQSDASVTQVIAELALAVQRLGLAGIWVTVDGLEAWLGVDEAAISRLFSSLFGTLAIFEDPGLTLKIFVPTTLKLQLAAAPGIIRRRLDLYDLVWSPSELRRMAENRLAVALGRDTVRLTDVCAGNRIETWLERYGGALPRGWLQFLRPLVDVYDANGGDRPLAESEWIEVVQRRPPRLRFDLARNKVFIGEGEVRDLLPGSLTLLRYLYTHQDQRCRREELYFRGYLGVGADISRDTVDASTEPQNDQKKRPQDWKHALDTYLHRLRQNLQPEPEAPRYLVTEKGGWVRLVNTM